MYMYMYMYIVDNVAYVLQYHPDRETGLSGYRPLGKPRGRVRRRPRLLLGFCQ